MKKWKKNKFGLEISKTSLYSLFFSIVLFFLTFGSKGLHLILESDSLANIESSILSLLTNTERQKRGVPALKINNLLNKAATLKAQDMASKGYFDHNSPDGKTPWYWFDKVGYKYKVAGENLAVNFGESKEITTAWMNSPLHEANIVKENYTEIGTGQATGTYNGAPAVYVVQLYGQPLKASK